MLERLQSMPSPNKLSDFTRYQDDPVGFAKDVLDITVTPDIAKMLESIRDNRITVARSATGTGKSHGASVASIWFYKCFPDSFVRTIANPTENQKILWGELSAMTERHPDLFSDDTIKYFSIKRGPKDFIEPLTVPTTGAEAVREGKFSGKHHAHMLYLFDEGDTVPDFAYRGVEGCMSGGLIVRLLILFNPRYSAGYPYRLEHKDKSANIIHLSAFNHPNVITGQEIIPGAVNRSTTVQRIRQWCRPLNKEEKAGKDTFELPKFLEGVTDDGGDPLKAGFYKIMEPAFSYMVLGEYPAQSQFQLISREWTAMARSRWDAHVAKFGEIPPRGTQCLGGLDAAEMGDDVNCDCFRWGGYVERLITWGGVDMMETGDRAARKYRKRRMIQQNVDAIGVGAGVAPHMRRLGCPNAISVKTSERPTRKSELGEFGTLRDQLAWEVREWLRVDPGAMLPPDDELLEELHTPTYDVSTGKVKVMPKRAPIDARTGTRRATMHDLLKRSPNKFDALCLTFAPRKDLGVRGNQEIKPSGFVWS